MGPVFHLTNTGVHLSFEQLLLLPKDRANDDSKTIHSLHQLLSAFNSMPELHPANERKSYGIGGAGNIRMYTLS